jgi:hypothetical protein
MKLEAASRLRAVTEVTAVEATPNQIKRFTSDLEKASGAKVLELKLHNLHPLEISVVVNSELGAYKLAYSYRHSKSGEMRVEPAEGIHGWLFSIRPH